MPKDKFRIDRRTIVYYQAMYELNLNIEEYLILDTMLHFRKDNCYLKGVCFLQNYLCISRNTIRKYLNSLVDNNFINKVGLTYHFISDVKARKEESSINSKFLIVQHALRNNLNLTIAEYSLLYLFYSYSKNNKHEEGSTANCSEYLKYVDITERAFYKVKRKLEQRELIRCYSGNLIIVENGIFDK